MQWPPRTRPQLLPGLNTLGVDFSLLATCHQRTSTQYHSPFSRERYEPTISRASFTMLIGCAGLRRNQLTLAAGFCPMRPVLVAATLPFNLGAGLARLAPPASSANQWKAGCARARGAVGKARRPLVRRCLNNRLRRRPFGDGKCWTFDGPCAAPPSPS